jgi:hypothetical protein
VKIKELEEQLGQLRMGKDMAGSNSGIEELTQKVQAMADMLAEGQKRQKELEAEVRWTNTVEKLSETMPVLRDPELRKLVPRTEDPEVLERVGSLLMQFQAKTEETAYKKVREGFVPATAPPIVTPGDEAGMERETLRVTGLLDAGEITPQEAQAQLQKIARMMKPE